jgi:phosphotransferase system IIB component
MLYWLVDKYLPWLEANGFGFLRVFNALTFQSVAAILVSFLICIAFGDGVIAWLRSMKFGDRATFDQAELDKLMEGKKGTPTMGGLLIISAIVVTTLLLADLRNFYVLMGLICVTGLGAIGASDDWLAALGGAANIQELQQRSTRLILRLADPARLDEEALKRLGARAVTRSDNGLIHLLLDQATATRVTALAG